MEVNEHLLNMLIADGTNVRSYLNQEVLGKLTGWSYSEGHKGDTLYTNIYMLADDSRSWLLSYKLLQYYDNNSGEWKFVSGMEIEEPKPEVSTPLDMLVYEEHVAKAPIQDHAPNESEMQDFLFDVRVMKVAGEGVRHLYEYFQKWKGSPNTQTREQYNIAITNLALHLFRGGESGMGAMLAVRESLNALREEVVVDRYIVDELIMSYDAMGPRWERWFMSGGSSKLNYT